MFFLPLIHGGLSHTSVLFSQTGPPSKYQPFFKQRLTSGLPIFRAYNL